MYLIIASRADESAEDLRSHLGRIETRIMTPLDLSRPGWYINNRKPLDSLFIAEKNQYKASRLLGVINLLPAIYEAELVQIVEEARGYVASEMTAFMKYWLSSLTCPILNPPTAGCLSGPNWRRAQWMLKAREAGLKTLRINMSTRQDKSGDVTESRKVTATLIGDRCVEEVEPNIVNLTKTLADRAGVPLISTSFSCDKNGRYLLSGVSTFPRLHARKSAPLIERYFSRAGDTQ